VRITGVEPLQPEGGIRIREFGLRPSPFWTHRGSGIGDAVGDVAHNHFPDAHNATLTCQDKTGRGYELGVVVDKPGSGPASFQSLAISYSSDGPSRSR
jgi:hypothetical protein